MEYTVETIIANLKENGNGRALEQMQHFGIKAKSAFGVKVPHIRSLAKEIEINHALTCELWKNDLHEARLLATMIADYKQITPEIADEWVSVFYSWDICDQCCSNLFWKLPFAYEKAKYWCTQEQEYVKRAGFVMMAVLAVHDKKATNDQFKTFIPFIIEGSTDERNFVKKAVNWAIRQIGKRNELLQKNMIDLSLQLKQSKSPAAKWIAADAFRELTNSKTRIKNIS
jgi:3-methyladenine DNA glycosylase AlkD